ncbi:hypothetical protein SLEP1_g29233 [Rubroshorea leprosula]|uniref:Uncharacterized protein n=1 Tax=Rubroshorea leprosula TaxID=152421 RepID=A0AAV5K5D6_9ROSI|nr:hypothetical protein SLEP1_g29233 [Rubroshorea leprosula]
MFSSLSGIRFSDQPESIAAKPKMPAITRASISPPLPPPPLNRRHLLLTGLTVSFSPLPLPIPPAGARGLLRMPPPRLSNRYFLVRAGESEYESLGIINTNPVAKTSVDSGLSEKGKKQTVRAALELQGMEACERNCWIWPSITQRAYQAAEIIASVNGVSRRYEDVNIVHNLLV